MTDLNTLKKILEVVIHADREMSQDTPLYKVKSLFDGLQLDGSIDFDAQHGEFIKIALDAKRKDKAMKNIIFARGILNSVIEEKEIAQAELDSVQKAADDLAFESTCTVVSVTDNENSSEVQLQLNDMPKKIGRPKSSNSLTGAQRAKRARDKKKANNLVTVNQTLSIHASILYNELLANGHDLNSILCLAHNAVEL